MKNDRRKKLLLEVMERRKYPVTTRELARISIMSPITVKKKLSKLEKEKKVRKRKTGDKIEWMLSQAYAKMERQYLDLLDNIEIIPKEKTIKKHINKTK